MSLETIATQWMEQFNAKNLEGLLALYAENAEHYSPKLKIRQPETNGLISGKSALREWWRDAFERLPTLFYKLETLTANDSRVFMEYMREVEGEEDLLIAEVLEVENSKIIASRVYHG